MRSTTVLDRVEGATWQRLMPPPRLSVSAWADTYRVLSPESSPAPGRWRTDTTPYLREIQDALTDPAVVTIVFLKSSQIGGTEVLVNALLYRLANDPGPAICLLPTLDLATAFSKDRLRPAIRDCAAIRDLVGAPRSRDADNTILRKGVGGAVLTIAGANAPTSLSSRPVRDVFADEIDRWPATVGSEGDPLALAMRRATAFIRRKVVLVSTPTVKGGSRIEDWFAVSDQRAYRVPCPRCATRFAIEWEHVRWDMGDPTTAHLECPGCGGRIEDHERHTMMAAGAWEPTAPFAGIRGYRAWEVFAPWRSLAEIVSSFLVAKRSLETRQVWVNTCQARCWELPGERLEPSNLLLRREVYDAELPAGVQILTCGVDTQDDRLEALIVGWGGGEESWIIDRASLPGDPSRPDVWHELDALLSRDWQHAAGGVMRVQCTLVDAGGHRTQAVYSAVLARQARRVFAAFGRAGGETGLLVSPAKAIRPASGPGVILRRIVDVDQTKALIFGRLRLAEPGPEYVHLPTTVGETFIAELTAEQLVTRRNKYGVPTKLWEQVRERNEALDALVLAMAALRILAPTPQRFATLAAQIAAAAAQPPGAPITTGAPRSDAVPAARRVRHSAYLSR